VLTAELLWVKWFLQLILFANTATFFCSLLVLASNSFWEGNSGKEISTWWLRVEKINHSRDVWLVLKTMPHKPTFHVYSNILDSFFYAYSAIMDSFVIVSFFEKHYIPQYYRWLTSLCLFKPMFWSRWLLFWVWYNLKTAAIPVHYVFCFPAVAHTSTHSVNLAIGPKLDFKNKWRAWARFRLGPVSGFTVRSVYNAAPRCANAQCQQTTCLVECHSRALATVQI